MWISHGLNFTVAFSVGFRCITLIEQVALHLPALPVTRPVVLIVSSFVFPPAVLHSLSLFFCLISPLFVVFMLSALVLHCHPDSQRGGEVISS